MYLHCLPFVVKTALIILLSCLSLSFAQTSIKYKTIDEIGLWNKTETQSSFETIPESTQKIFDSLRIKYDLKNIDLGCVPTRIIIPPGLNKAFVLVSDDYKLYIIDLSSGDISKIITFNEIPKDIIINHQCSHIFVLTWKTYDDISTESCRGVKYASSVGPGNTYVINITSNNIEKELFPYATPEIPYVKIFPYVNILLSPDDNYLYMCGTDNWIYVYDLFQNKLVKVINLTNRQLFNSALSVDGSKICTVSIDRNEGNSSHLAIPVIIDVNDGSVTNINFKGYDFFFTLWLNIAMGDKNTFYIKVLDNATDKSGMIMVNGISGEILKFLPGVSPEAGMFYNSDSSLAFLHYLTYTDFGYESVLLEKLALLDMQSLDIENYIPANGFSLAITSDFKKLFSANHSTSYGGLIEYGFGINTNVTVNNLDLGITYEIPINNDKTQNKSTFRPIAVSSDGNYIMTGNAYYHNISIISGLEELTPKAPSTESAVLDSSNSTLSMLFKWNKPESAYNFYLQVSDSANFNNIVFEDSLLSNINCAVNSLLPNTNYFWRVKAKNLVGWSEWSDTASFQTINVPQKPVLASPSINESHVNINPVLKWNNVEASMLYKLQISDDSLFTNLVFNDSLITDISKQADSLVNNTTYFWRVYAKNQAGWSEPSDTWSFKTIVCIPEQVKLIYPDNKASLMQDSIEFKWSSDDLSVTGYWFELTEDTLIAAFVKDSSLTDTIKSITGFSSNKNYWWRIKALNAAGWGDFSDYYSFIISYCDVNGNIMPAEYCLSQNYPNPFNPSTNINFSLKEPGQVSIIVYNMLGEKISELLNEYRAAGSYNIEFKANEIPSGIYFYTIKSGNFAQTRKMLLLR